MCRSSQLGGSDKRRGCQASGLNERAHVFLSIPSKIENEIEIEIENENEIEIENEIESEIEK